MRDLKAAHLEVAGGAIEVHFAQGQFDLPESTILGWVSTSARAVARYYGQFPVRHASVFITPVKGTSGVLRGTSFGYDGPMTKIWVGQYIDEKELHEDWKMTHEMVHWAFPSVDDEHHWIEEGIATYVEPIARLEIGELTAEQVWGDLVRGLPNGLPGPADRGLDRTHTWGRTYWGGALFCLLADMEIHRRTRNHLGLRDALRAIAAAGGTIDARWELARALKIGDQACGVPVLSELYDKMKDTPVDPDLDALWRDLGIAMHGSEVTFDDHARFAAVRRAIAASGG